jgi:hypothetical protein
LRNGSIDSFSQAIELEERGNSMPNLLVLKDKHIIDQRQFRETLIVIGQKELSWQFYPSEEGIWTSSVNYIKSVIAEDKIKDGGRQLTILHKMGSYEISCVLPNWEFSINGSKLSKGFYDTIDIAWKEIKLASMGYEFIFTFDFSNDVSIDFPKPIY